MATHILARVSWPSITQAPKDRVVISPCFRHQLGILAGGPEWNDLARDLGDGITAWNASSSGECQVKLYDLEGATPNYPKATYTKNSGVVHNPSVAGQLAVCLSFYSDMNVPRKRGRLYLPAWVLGGSGASATAYVPAGLRTKALALGPILAGLGGVNVDWIVWSRVANSASRVQNLWVDDQWDIQRRRKHQRVALDRATTGG